MRLMNQVFNPFPCKFVVVYIDDILVFKKTQEEHFEHLRQVMLVLEQEILYGNLKKCSFFTLEVVFLRCIVFSHGIQVDQSKVDAIKSWSVPSSMHNVRSFTSLASFYRTFIYQLNSIAAPMTEVLKGTKFIRTSQAQKSFEELKDKLTHACVLALPCFEKVFEIECLPLE